MSVLFEYNLLRYFSQITNSPKLACEARRGVSIEGDVDSYLKGKGGEDRRATVCTLLGVLTKIQFTHYLLWY